MAAEQLFRRPRQIVTQLLPFLCLMSAGAFAALSYLWTVHMGTAEQRFSRDLVK